MDDADRNPNLSLHLSARGQALLKSFECGPAGNRAPEGYAPKPYRCPAGVLTVGWGHRVRMTDRLSSPIDAAKAQELFEADCAVADIYVRAACAPTALTQYEFDALVLFVFNLGIRAFERSTLRELVKSGQMFSAAAQFPRWNKVTVRDRGRDVLVVADGLVIRRNCERMLFQGADDGEIAVARAVLEARAADGSLA